MKKYPKKLRAQAVTLRKSGLSIKEISAKLHISQSTASNWLQTVVLSTQAQEKLREKRALGRMKANVTKRRRRKVVEQRVYESISEQLSSFTLNVKMARIICAVLYWAEGNKSGSSVGFINSDPKMIQTFLSCLRTGFSINEKKLRALLHVHEYHDDETQKKRWSKISGIPLDQFNRSYKKPHTKKRKKEGYQGSLRIRYYDAELARELTALYTMLSELVAKGP